MSNYQFVECLSSDPFVRSLGRQVSRLMNDPTLGSVQKQRLVIGVQERLEAYQAAQMVKASKKGRQQEKRETTVLTGGQVAADPKGLTARRREFGLVEGTIKEPTVRQKPHLSIAANDEHSGGWHRPLLTLKRA